MHQYDCARPRDSKLKNSRTKIRHKTDPKMVRNKMLTNPKKLSAFIDAIELEERKIHHGIASGRYEDDDVRDRREEHDDDDDYGKLLFNVSWCKLNIKYYFY